MPDTIRKETAHKLARFTLFSFLMTFVLSRVFVMLIMSKMMPNMYCFVHGTHVHQNREGLETPPFRAALISEAPLKPQQ